MGMVTALLRIPFLWQISQNVFCSDAAKGHIYREAIGPSGGRVLDFGCANGNAFHAFQDLDYFGVDIDERFVRDARQKYAHHPNAHFIHADILRRPLEPGYFDHVLFACTGHHLEDQSLVRILVALGRCLKPDGVLHFFDPIRVSETDGVLLKMIMHADQGRYHRSAEQYRQVFSALADHFRLGQVKTFRLETGRLIPQPTMLYARLSRNSVVNEQAE